MNTVSLMMVTYNRLDLTKRMLDNFFQVTTSPYRLIIVDNGSTDGTPEYLSSLDKRESTFCQGIYLKFNEKNKGIASGRNQGLKIASQFGDDYLGTLDNDIELPTNWLQNCIDIIAANPSYSIGVNMEDVSYPLKTLNGQTFQFKELGNLGSACMVFTRELHREIGYFTTEYEHYGEEDANWGFRARRMAYNFGYLKEPGLHFGIGDLDIGEYRAFKDECRQKNLSKFQKDCYAYMQGMKPIFHPYSEK
jgi:GT2 family glycosyltransferase